MHELIVTKNIPELSLHHAQSSHAQRVTDLHLVIGQLSSLIDDSVQFYWDIISKGTICEGARLHFERRSAVLLCLDCGKSYAIKNELFPCPKCTSTHIRVVEGEEFRLESVEIVS